MVAQPHKDGWICMMLAKRTTALRACLQSWAITMATAKSLRTPLPQMWKYILARLMKDRLNRQYWRERLVRSWLHRLLVSSTTLSRVGFLRLTVTPKKIVALLEE